MRITKTVKCPVIYPVTEEGIARARHYLYSRGYENAYVMSCFEVIENYTKQWRKEYNDENNS
jgi:hypothetical protein